MVNFSEPQLHTGRAEGICRSAAQAPRGFAFPRSHPVRFRQSPNGYHGPAMAHRPPIDRVSTATMPRGRLPPSAFGIWVRNTTWVVLGSKSQMLYSPTPPIRAASVRAPRIECGGQPVASSISSMAASVLRPRRSMIRACYEFERTAGSDALSRTMVGENFGLDFSSKKSVTVC